MSQHTLDHSIQATLIEQLNAAITETLREYKGDGISKALQTHQCDNVASLIESVACSFQKTDLADEDTDLRLKILLQSKQILLESKYNTLQRLLKLLEENSLGSAQTPKTKALVNKTDENSVNFTTTQSTKDPNKKRKRAALTEHKNEDINLKLKSGFKAQHYQGARVFAFEDSDEHEESPSKRARTEDQLTRETDGDLLMALRPVNEDLADDVDLFALDSESESRQLVGSRECTIDVDLSKFNFERLEEKSSQPEHISSQPGRSMDVKKKLQQIESYLSETSEPQESCERDELPTLLAYQLSQTDYAAMVREEESLSKSKEDD